MAIHFTSDSMKIESLKEMLEVADYCINFDKRKAGWRMSGCYGYPAAILLLAIVDSIGAHVKGGGADTKKHFEILNDPDWYDLRLSAGAMEVLRNDYRNKLTHESIVGANLFLNIGDAENKVLEQIKGYYRLNLKAFLQVSKRVVDKLISSLELSVWVDNPDAYDSFLPLQN